MLLSFFLPTYWKSKLLIAQNVLSMGIRDGFLITCLASVSRTKTTILNISSILLPEETAPHPTFEAQAECIQKALIAAGKYDHLVITESSENILFKELEFPFSTREQLDLVLYEELEPQLPFNPSEAYTGFTINQVRPDGTSTSLTATLKKTDFDTKFAPFSAAKILPNSVAVETQGIAFCIDQLYPSSEDGILPLRIVVDTKNSHTQLIFMVGSIIKAVKNIPFGKKFLYPSATPPPPPAIEPTEETAGVVATIPEPDIPEKTLPEVPEQILKAPERAETTPQNVATFIDKILFTCDALAFKYCGPETTQILFFLNAPCNQEILRKALDGKTDKTLEFFSQEKADTCPTIFKSKLCETIDWETMCAIIGSAGLRQSQNTINLPVDAVKTSTISTIKKNVFVSCLILAGIVGTVTAVGYRQLSTLGRVLEVAENTQLIKLKEKFPAQLADQRKLTLKRAITCIEDYVKEQQIFWNMFGSKSLNPLEILYELTELIDRRLFTIDITHVTIALSEDDHTPRITVEGTFMSKTDAHYSDFGLLEKHLTMSKRLMLTKDIESSFDDNAHGVKFTARFKLRDQ